jgi:cobalt-zinc-cadmium resistance protein CzcA
MVWSEGTRTIKEVVIEGALRRMRPVVLTATIAAFGLIPFLFATGPGAEIQRPLAIVVIGGLISATILTLVLLPILYFYSADLKQKLPRLMGLKSLLSKKRALRA